jgi:hypothetical protein
MFYYRTLGIWSLIGSRVLTASWYLVARPSDFYFQIACVRGIFSYSHLNLEIGNRIHGNSHIPQVRVG